MTGDKSRESEATASVKITGTTALLPAARMPFGRYMGRRLSELPHDYVAWLVQLPDLRAPLRGAVRAEVARRAARWRQARHRSTRPRLAAAGNGAGHRNATEVATGNTNRKEGQS